MRDVQVMMLAAGFGTRLWPLTADRAKPAVPFLGRPLIRGMLDWLIRHGARRVVVNAHHQPASIEAALADAPPDIDLRFSRETAILGTAGALAQAVRAGHLAADRPTLVVNAKLVTDIDLAAALAAHRESGARVTMVLRPNLRREAFTTVRVDGDRVVGFGPSRVPEGPAPLVFTGVHLLEPEVLARAEPRFSDTVRDLYPPELEARRVRAHVDADATWAEASTLERYVDLQVEALRAGARFVHPEARVAPSAAVERAWIGPGAEVEAGARLVDAVLGPGARAAAHARLEGAVLWAEARADRGARLRRGVLGEGAGLPAGAELEDAVGVVPEAVGAPPDGQLPLEPRLGLAVRPLGA
jgi:NDP-sugar pyrophosphorylase family protein